LKKPESGVAKAADAAEKVVKKFSGREEREIAEGLLKTPAILSLRWKALPRFVP